MWIGRRISFFRDPTTRSYFRMVHPHGRAYFLQICATTWIVNESIEILKNMVTILNITGRVREMMMVGECCVD